MDNDAACGRKERTNQKFLDAVCTGREVLARPWLLADAPWGTMLGNPVEAWARRLTRSRFAACQDWQVRKKGHECGRTSAQVHEIEKESRMDACLR